MPIRSKFFTVKQAQIDFKESRIRLNHEHFFLDSDEEDWMNTPDKQLSEKVFNVSTKD